MLAPCICTATIISKPKCPTDCLIVPGLKVSGDDAPSPCEGTNGTVQLDLKDYVDTTTCSVSPVFYIVDYDTDFFSTATVDLNTGIVTMGLQDDVEGGDYSDIVYRVNCPNSVLSAVNIIRVFAKDLCVGQTCSSTQTCNYCTGLCEDIVPDVELS